MPAITPFRFLKASSLAVLWFARAGLEAKRYLRTHPDDMLVSHLYARRMGEGFARIFRFEYTIRNEERLLELQPCVYISNHTSNLDLLTFARIFPPRTVVIAKKEILKVPLFGEIFARSRCIPINRSDKEDARAGIAVAVDALVKERLSIYIFPEGTRNFGKLRPFKKGAFHLAKSAGVPIVPVLLATPPGWLRGRRLFLRKSTPILIEVLEPVDPLQFASNADLMAHCHEIFATNLARMQVEVSAM